MQQAHNQFPSIGYAVLIHIILHNGVAVHTLPKLVSSLSSAGSQSEYDKRYCI